MGSARRPQYALKKIFGCTNFDLRQRLVFHAYAGFQQTSCILSLCRRSFWALTGFHCVPVPLRSGTTSASAFPSSADAMRVATRSAAATSAESGTCA